MPAKYAKHNTAKGKAPKGEKPKMFKDSHRKTPRAHKLSHRMS